MDDPTLALVRAVHQKEIDRLRALGDPKPEPPPIPYTELPELPADSPYFRSWNTYRFVVGEYLAVGLEGAWLVINADAILGIYPSARMASFAFANESQGFRDALLIKQIVANERESTLRRLKSRCPTSLIPLAKTA